MKQLRLLMKQLRLLSMAILTITLCMVSCSVEDGIDGTNGENGIDGTNGTNGTQGENGIDGINGIDGAIGENGIDGANGQGFYELTKFGYINLEMQGTRPDDIAFDDAASFKFTSVTGGGLENLNSVSSLELGADEISYEFTIQRFFSTPDDVFQRSFIQWNLFIINPGQPSQVIDDAVIQISNYAVIGDDNKYFVMGEGFEGIDFGISDFGISDFEISDLTYDTTTHNLTFSYSLLADASTNDSGNDLNISGTVDVIVLEQIVN